MPGTAKKGKATLIGNAGEYFVMGELLRREIVAALAPRNAPDYDILATDGQKTIQIRVKTRLKARGWQWNAKKNGTVFRNMSKNDFCILVDLGEGPPEYFIMPTKKIDRIFKNEFEVWIRTPGKGGRPHDPKNPRRILDKERHKKILQQHKNCWDKLGLTIGSHT